MILKDYQLAAFYDLENFFADFGKNFAQTFHKKFLQKIYSLKMKKFRQKK